MLNNIPPPGERCADFSTTTGRLGNGVIGRVNDLARTARKEFVDEVILAAPRDRDVTLQVLQEARRLRLDLEIVPELFGCKPAKEASRQSEWLDLPVICLHAERLPVAALVLKRLVDVFGAGLALIVLSPLLVAIAVLVKLDSPGAILYCAERAGRKGRLFRCYKFRTMVSNADELKSSLRRNNERSGPTLQNLRRPKDYACRPLSAALQPG